MIVRLATENDLYKGLQLFDVMAKEDKFRADMLEDIGITYDRAITEESIAMLVKNKRVFIMIKENKIIGVMAGMIARSFFSNDTLFQSYLFWVQKKHRRYVGKFIEKVDKVLKLTNISKFIMSNLDIGDYERLNRFYAIKGFKRLESHFVRSL